MFTKLTAIGIKVHDFSKAFSYYKEVLELTVHIEDQENEFAEFTIGDIQLALLTEATLKDMSEKINIVSPRDNTTLLAVEVSDLQKTYEELSEKGVQFIQNPKTTPWGAKSILLQGYRGLSMGSI